MDLTIEEFNTQVPLGTEVLYFPHGDGLPIYTATVISKAFTKISFSYPVCGLRIRTMDGDLISTEGFIQDIEECTQEQYEEIRRILDRR